MSQVPAQDLEQRVLVLAPTRKDGELVATLLEEDGIACCVCADLQSLERELDGGASAIILAEEAVAEPSIASLSAKLGAQPPWSDLPVLILTRHGANSPEAVRSLATLGNVTLLERPARVASMISAVRSALRARSRQYQLRAQFQARDAEGRRRETELAVANALALAANAHDALQGILGSVCENQGWSCGSVWEVGSDERIGCAEVWCGSSSAFPEFIDATRTMRFERGIGLPGRVWATGAPAFIADVIRDANFPRGRFAALNGLHSAFALPIRHEEEVVGAMEFLSEDIRRPDPELLAMMGAIGANIGQVLETKRAQERLLHSEANLSDFFENATVGLHWVGPDGTILRANRAELQMLGYSADEYVGHSIVEFHEDREVIDDILERLTCGESLADYQARLRCKDGSIKVVVISSSVLREEGRFVHTRCFTRDITARVQAEAELVDLRNELAADLEGMTRLQQVSRVLVQAADARSVLIDVIDAATSIMGADMGLVQVVNRHTRDLEVAGARGFGEHALDVKLDLVPALKSERRIVIADIENDALLAGSPARTGMLGAGARASQSTLMVTRSGVVLGVLSTYWKRVHTPGERELRLLDLLVREAADFVERIQAEEVLRERTELLELAHEAIVVRDTAGRVHYWSSGAEETYGYAAADIVGRSMHEVLQTRFPRPLDRIERELVRKGRWEGELVHVHESGREIVTDSRWVLRRGDEGKQVFVLEINRDITDKKASDAALQASEERVRDRAQELETLMDAVPALVFVAHDVDCKRITGNRAAYELLRSHPGANLSIGASEFERPKHFRMLRAGVELTARTMPMRIASSGSAARDEELEVVFDDGTRRHLYGSAIPLLGDDGEPRGAIGSFIDITDRKRIEEALRQSERVYRGIGESIEYGVWVCDADGGNVYVSDSFLKLTGLTQSECAGFAWIERLHEDDREEALRSWQECVAARQPWYFEHRILGVDGRYHPILARGTPVYDETGELVCWAGINLDIARLKEAQESLRVADRRKDEFLATLAHELRNPLAPIRTSVQLLRGLEFADPDFLWSREVIDRQTQQLTRLVDDLLDVSRITRGKVELRREHIMLGDVVRNVLDATRALVHAAGHKLRVVQPEEAIRLHADPVRLSQCLSNLLHNAVKYTPPGGHIEFVVEREGEQVAIRVRDDGIGIAAAEIEGVFEMFNQAETSLDRAQGGLGIGLSIVRTFVQMHGGTVEARSGGRGQGSEFVVRLPIDASRETASPSNPSMNGVKRNGSVSHRVLVVDDNKDSAESLSIFLRRSGHEVHTAYDGQQAIDALAQFHPRVVVLDIGLPGLSGFEVARRMRTQPGGEGLLLIAATGWGQAEHLSRSREAGFDHHLVKPIDVLALQRLIAGT